MTSANRVSTFRVPRSCVIPAPQVDPEAFYRLDAYWRLQMALYGSSADEGQQLDEADASD